MPKVVDVADLQHWKPPSELTPKLSERVVYWTPSAYPSFTVGSPIGCLAHKYQGWLLVRSMVIHKSKLSFSEGPTGTERLVTWSLPSSHWAMTRSPDWLFLETDAPWARSEYIGSLKFGHVGARHSFASITVITLSSCNCPQAPRQLRKLTEHLLCTRPSTFVITFNPY